MRYVILFIIGLLAFLAGYCYAVPKDFGTIPYVPGADERDMFMRRYWMVIPMDFENEIVPIPIEMPEKAYIRTTFHTEWPEDIKHLPWAVEIPKGCILLAVEVYIDPNENNIGDNVMIWKYRVGAFETKIFTTKFTIEEILN
jgi:hypothetical protein